MGPRGARSLLILLLAEYVLPGDGTAPTRSVLAACDALGVSEPAARQALRRLAHDGWLVRSATPGRWVLGPTGERLLAEGKARFARNYHGTRSWDGQWLLLRTTVPEARRDLRHQLRAALAFQGFGSLGQGWWVSADVGMEAVARDILERLGIEQATTFHATSGAIGADDAALVAEAWRLDEAAARYEKLVDEVGGLRVDDDGSAFVAYTRMIDTYRWALAADPQLPHELLPDDWPGAAARQLVDDGYARWRAAAERWWASR